MPYVNEEEAKASNGGAYPPDMSVLVKARAGGADYIYSVLLGYEDPPEGMKLDDGVYYNKYMYGQKIKMPQQLYDDLVTYADGTPATPEQMAKLEVKQIQSIIREIGLAPTKAKNLRKMAA